MIQLDRRAFLDWPFSGARHLSSRHLPAHLVPVCLISTGTEVSRAFQAVVSNINVVSYLDPWLIRNTGVLLYSRDPRIVENRGTHLPMRIRRTPSRVHGEMLGLYAQRQSSRQKKNPRNLVLYSDREFGGD